MPQTQDIEKQYSTVKKNYLKFLDLLNKANQERFTNPQQYNQFMETLSANATWIQQLYDNYYNMRDQVTQARKNNDNTIITGLRWELEKMPTMQQPPVSIASEPMMTSREVQQPMMTWQTPSVWQTTQEPMMTKQEPMMTNQNTMTSNPQQQTMQQTGWPAANSAVGWMLTTLNQQEFKPKWYSVRL